MKNLKMLQAAFVIALLSIVVGCSDQFTSPNQEFVKSSNKGEISEGTDKLSNPPYGTQISLKAGGIYKFDLSNTGLNSFNSIKVSKVLQISSQDNKIDQCSGIRIYSSNYKNDFSCQGERFNLNEIFIQNTSSSELNLEVVLYGTRPEVKYFDIE